MPINISSNFIIERDEVYTSASGAAFDAYGLNAIEFINYGTIRASGSNAVGFSSYISSGLIHNAGLMEVRSTDTGYGFSSPQWMAAIRNTGQVRPQARLNPTSISRAERSASCAVGSDKD